MSLDFSAPLLPPPAPFSSPDFITTQARKSSHSGLPAQQPTSDQRDSSGEQGSANNQAAPLVDRRVSREGTRGYERRQFGSSHANLSPEAAELAIAIDQYKLENRRRYITCEEMLMVITKLGYSR